ncbi:MAG TPA: OmpA family protein [Rhizomicrobium sp.]|nr:OmpA family protein [Rhizomicrobium sp.]
MKRLPWLAALCLCASPAWGMDDGDPQTRCGADWLPAYTFASGAEGVTPNGHAMTADVVRLARFCRYGAVRIVAFVGSDLAEAQRRAAWIRRELLADHWPGTRIDLEFRPRNQAPHGMDLRQTFTADEIVEFEKPDPNWRERPDPRPRPSPQWITEPWPALPIHMPMAFFASGDAALTAPGRSVTDEGARRFLHANCRILPVYGYADTAEADPDGIALKRALAVRDELVRAGVAPDAIPVYARGTAYPLVPTPQGVPEPQNRRADMDCVD